MIVLETVQVNLTPEDSRLFIEFQKHYKKIVTLLNSGALDIKNGRATLHFDQDGTLRDIDRADKLHSS